MQIHYFIYFVFTYTFLCCCYLFLLQKFQSCQSFVNLALNQMIIASVLIVLYVILFFFFSFCWQFCNCVRLQCNKYICNKYTYIHIYLSIRLNWNSCASSASVKCLAKILLLLIPIERVNFSTLFSIHKSTCLTF